MGHWKEIGLGRRRFIAAAGAGVGAGLIGAPLARPALGATKPEKLVFMIDNAPWHGALRDAAVEFEKDNGIPIEFTVLPDDALVARLKSELSAQSTGIDILQFTVTWVSWIAPHVDDHAAMIASASNQYSGGFAWDDIPQSVHKMANWDNKLCGVPYRVVMSVLHYQPEVLKQAGFDKPPANWDELLATAQAVTKAGDGKRYGLGFTMREGPAINDSWITFLRSNGGDLFDPKTHEILVNKPAAVESLRYYSDLLNKYHVVPPDAVTWEWDEIIANGQNDRYGMTVAFAPSGTMLNDPKVSRTGGKWAATVAPGAHSVDQSRTILGGWSLSVPRYSQNKDWAFAFIQMAAGKEWALRSLSKGNCPAHLSALKDPAVAQQFPWAPAGAKALETAVTDPQDPIWGAMDLALRTGLSRVLLGQSEPQAALDAVAVNWQRIMRRGNAL
jgi:multiple sugar transport system substrate-binding protein